MRIQNENPEPQAPPWNPGNLPNKLPGKKESSKRVSTIGEFPDEQARSLSTITNI